MKKLIYVRFGEDSDDEIAMRKKLCVPPANMLSIYSAEKLNAMLRERIISLIVLSFFMCRQVTLLSPRNMQIWRS